MADLQTLEQAEAQRMRRKAQWRAHCLGRHTPSACPCIEPCASCGHLAAEHHLSEGHRTFVVMVGACERDECDCSGFRSDKDDE